MPIGRKKTPEAVCLNFVSVLPLLKILPYSPSTVMQSCCTPPLSFLFKVNRADQKCQILFLLFQRLACLARAVTFALFLLSRWNRFADLPTNRHGKRTLPSPILLLIRRGVTNPHCFWRKTRVRRTLFRIRYILLMRGYFPKVLPFDRRPQRATHRYFFLPRPCRF